MHLMIRVVFMGSPDFAVPILREVASSYAVVGVVTQPDRGAGRGRELKAPAVKQAAAELGLPVFQPSKLGAPEALEQLRSWSPELIVVAAFGQILRPAVLALPQHGCINVHASLLPRWRGAAPIQAAIAAGDPESGVTVMKMDEGVDTGPIIAQRAIPVGGDETGESLSKKLAELGSNTLMEVLPPYLAGELALEAQRADLATYAPMLKAADGLLDFSESAVGLARRVRALLPWPGAYLIWKGLRLKVHRAHAGIGTAAPGERLVWSDQAAVGAKDGLLILDEVQLAGRKPVDGRAFLMGARDWAS